MLLMRGERQLLRIVKDGQCVGWATIRIDQLPNVRVLHVCSLYAPGNHFVGCFEPLKALAVANGCEEMRCCAGRRSNACTNARPLGDVAHDLTGDTMNPLQEKRKALGQMRAMSGGGGGSSTSTSQIVYPNEPAAAQERLQPVHAAGPTKTGRPMAASAMPT